MKFGYGKKYKYEGMLAHLFDRVYVVTKLPLIKYDKESNYLHDLDDKENEQIKENIRDLLSYCPKLIPYMSF